MNLRRRMLWTAFALLAAALVQAQGNEGVGVAPDRLIIPDGQPGETYLRTVTFQHQYDTAGTIRVEVDGAESAWVTTEPASPFTMAARTNRDVTVTVNLPGNAAPGDHNTTLRFIRQSADAPSGSGASVEVSAGIHLDIHVGGQANERLVYLSARVEDAALGSPVHAFVRARNDGNVRATAAASGRVLPFEGTGADLSAANGTLVLVPGEEGEVPVTFPAGLDAGQYLARLDAAGFNATLPFKVTANGTAPDGVLRAIVHAARPKAHHPVRIEAWFENQGSVRIASATFQAEILDGDEVLAVLDSSALVVDPGQSVNLTVTWTPPKAGTYRIVGHVTYDGFQTLANENLLNVERGSPPFPWWALALLAAVLVIVGVVVWSNRRERRKAGRR